MDKWTSEELSIFEKIDELHISLMRSDGEYSNPLTIWVVAVGDNVYIRAVKGITGPWYVHAKQSGRGRIEIGELIKNIRFEESQEKEPQAIDDAYKEKYKSYSDDIVESILTMKARDATLMIVPDR